MRMRRKEWMDKELENSSFYLENAICHNLDYLLIDDEYKVDIDI